MQINVSIGELVIIAVLAVLALFWLLPSIARGIKNFFSGSHQNKNND